MEERTRKNLKLILELAAVVIAVFGILLSHGGMKKELARLETNQAQQHVLIERQSAGIDELIRGQKQVHERLLALRGQRTETPKPTDSGNDLTETLDYIGDVPKRVGKEAERFLDRINPF